MKIIHGDSLNVLKQLPSESVDAVCTDPPYGLAFMNKHWDYDVPSVELWREVLRVLKPGGHAFIACGTRTQHRQVVNIEDAGFEIRDVITHLYGSGFPKSSDPLKAGIKQGIFCGCKSAPEHDMRSVRGSDIQASLNTSNECGEVLQPLVPEQSTSGAVLRTKSEESSALAEESSMEGRCDLQADEGKLHRTEVRTVSEELSSNGAEGRLHNGTSLSDGDASGQNANADGSSASPGSQHAKQPARQSRVISHKPGTQTCGSCGKAIGQAGLGSALKPAAEFWTLCRKPLEKNLTIASNLLKHGTGAINVDASRIGDNPGYSYPNGPGGNSFSVAKGVDGTRTTPVASTQGRWPANVLFSCACEGDTHDSACAVAVLDEQSGVSPSNKRAKKSANPDTVEGQKLFKVSGNASHDDSGGASRFFYVAKASKRERNAGLAGMPERECTTKQQNSAGRMEGGEVTNERPPEPRSANHHPTVKPIKLMEYLVRMITPPGGTVLDPFLGSGTTLVAAKQLGFTGIGIERESEYINIARKRIEHAPSPVRGEALGE